MHQIYFVAAFSEGEGGELFRVGEPQRFETEGEARKVASDLASSHAGVVAWLQETAEDKPGYGPPIVFYTAGEVIHVK